MNIRVGDTVELKPMKVKKAFRDNSAMCEFGGEEIPVPSGAIARVIPRPIAVGDKVKAPVGIVTRVVVHLRGNYAWAIGDMDSHPMSFALSDLTHAE
ncbi:hypothetical protein UFOVP1204_36 [uncultured Caudovirales phage]|uniref:Uncharacterized protein n=1 Tax=uncultured Caudovirales phage TaxID=2100421 RepID=A0A6J5PY05_9CAUD|nr:hypothetical protein UFOVP473_65 [uncultured Caudovirales phage]CAB4176873.1 hypothetical protein UFOVP983_65 [uncultured Caudovirales phage]CAB4189996.1 hypothetical protein UFOVP1204_36 [uncultured Caudovirales phage]